MIRARNQREAAGVVLSNVKLEPGQCQRETAGYQLWAGLANATREKGCVARCERELHLATILRLWCDARVTQVKGALAEQQPQPSHGISEQQRCLEFFGKE